jgi:hypothetical protein
LQGTGNGRRAVPDARRRQHGAENRHRLGTVAQGALAAWATIRRVACSGVETRRGTGGAHCAAPAVGRSVIREAGARQTPVKGVGRTRATIAGVGRTRATIAKECPNDYEPHQILHTSNRSPGVQPKLAASLPHWSRNRPAFGLAVSLSIEIGLRHAVRGETFAFLKLGFIGLGTAFAEQRGDFRLMLAKPCKQFWRRRGGCRQPYLAIRRAGASQQELERSKTVFPIVVTGRQIIRALA